MLSWILIVGGLLIMMGQHDRSETLFYYFRLEDQFPEIQLLWLIERHVSFAFVREKLKASYGDPAGRPPARFGHPDSFVTAEALFRALALARAGDAKRMFVRRSKAIHPY
jgi:hypothetical protein